MSGSSTRSWAGLPAPDLEPSRVSRPTPPGGGALGFAVAGVLLLAMLGIALCVGRFPVSPGELLALLWSWS